MVDAVMIERSAIEPYLEPAARGGSGLESATGAGLDTPDTPDTPDAPDSDASLADQLLAVERRLVAMALENCDGNIAAAARTLGLDRANLHRRLKRLGLRT
jgi:transcriptional regulator with GAF, ATPase, and Fis domain